MVGGVSGSFHRVTGHWGESSKFSFSFVQGFRSVLCYVRLGTEIAIGMPYPAAFMHLIAFLPSRSRVNDLDRYAPVRKSAPGWHGWGGRGEMAWRADAR